MTKIFRIHFNHAGDYLDVEAESFTITDGAVVFSGGDRAVGVSLASLSYFEELLPPD